MSNNEVKTLRSWISGIRYSMSFSLTLVKLVGGLRFLTSQYPRR